jgi:hypothetical protein
MINCDLYDAMDHDRCIVPRKDLGSHYLCDVYWRDSGYGGKVKLAKSLFGNRWIGFVAKEDLVRD